MSLIPVCSAVSVLRKLLLGWLDGEDGPGPGQYDQVTNYSSQCSATVDHFPATI